MLARLPSAAAGERSMSAAMPGGNAWGFLQVERDLPRGLFYLPLTE
jgi:hypothetical protein